MPDETNPDKTVNVVIKEIEILFDGWVLFSWNYEIIMTLIIKSIKLNSYQQQGSFQK